MRPIRTPPAESGATATGNRRHFTQLTPLGTGLVRDATLRILTPREFLEQTNEEP